MTAARKISGFSLLELLVVVFMIGILVTMFTLSVGVTGSDRELEREVDRLGAILSLAADEAVMHGREYGLRFYPGTYEFSTWFEEFDASEEDPQKRDKSRWILLTEDDILAPRELAEGLQFELEIEGRRVVLKHKTRREIQAEDEDKLDYEPQLFIFSSGDMSPFLVKIRRRFESDGITLDVDADGEIERIEETT